MIQVATFIQSLIGEESILKGDREIERFLNEGHWQIADISVIQISGPARVVTLTRDTAKSTQRAVRDFKLAFSDLDV